ncbi:MAG TPA: biotin--[acetyl-CoA-carboxylase] ligase [Oscillatoriaceae cyanobacterium M33_DOE_052]|uniref:Biotin--[acetyl-CoA-carboxylase] ligase n=1 Tax=Planktothricoides sp. SpSt-374 TaxID=2282167 RepID=A0A7C3VHS0_9CYAN|nr:biotin--[acetyl-CoA-carboxylase] ligase [Oscillatoriaceae cyanobacterium M33_DOE_052]
MTLNRERLQAAIEEVSSFLGTHYNQQQTTSLVHIFDSLTSTNQTAWELLADGAPPRTAVIAARQTGGRGQWGRQWVSEIGGLYLSLIITPQTLVKLGAATNSPQLTMSIALALAMCLRTYQVPVLLKWPNDLLLENRKLGGILTETRVHQSQISKAVVGVGINWANPVPPTGINLQTFLASQINPQITSLEMLAAVVLAAIGSGEALIQRENDMATWLPSYQNLLTSMGTAVTIGGRQGVVVGVTTTGELKVRLSPPNGSTAEYPTPKIVPEALPGKIPPDVMPGEEICLAPGTITLGYQQPPNIF